MQIIVNGQRRECAPANLAELLLSETQDGEEGQGDAMNEMRGYAIALNGGVVRRDAWAKTQVNDGDRIEIVRAMQGG
jgi:sulfur carrier protein